jgi:hypothetical protein
MSWCTRALKLNRDNPEIWRLVVLLWTSEAQIEKALDVCQLALREHPENDGYAPPPCGVVVVCVCVCVCVALH